MIIRENVPISSLTTMRLGGVARFVIEIEQPEDIAQAYDFAKKQGLSTWIMGGGANTIGQDAGFDGVILLNRIKGIFAEVGGKTVAIPRCQNNGATDLVITAMGGEIWDDLVKIACELGYSGIEAMSMIPGTVGAAPVQNIGAYGQDVAGVIESVKVYDTKKCEITTLEKSEMGLGYRHTRFNFGEDAGRFFIISATFQLRRQTLKPPFYNSLQNYLDEHKIQDYSPMTIRNAVCAIRTEKLPDPEKIASAGSFFKNVYVAPDQIAKVEAEGIPVRKDVDGRGKINSGWLIEQCGLKGKELFGFRVSDKAALVLINEHAKSYADLVMARQEIIDTVYNKFGLKLEQEPVEIPVI